MVGYSWLIANKVSKDEYHLAMSRLMTGPRATKPTFRAIRKTIGRIRRGDKAPYGSWRSAPALVHQGE